MTSGTLKSRGCFVASGGANFKNDCMTHPPPSASKPPTPLPAVRALIKDLAHENLIIVTHAARTIELLGAQSTAAREPMEMVLIRVKKYARPILRPQ